MEWLIKEWKAIDYIEDNLDKEISYDEAAPHCVLFSLLFPACFFPMFRVCRWRNTYAAEK